MLNTPHPCRLIGVLVALFLTSAGGAGCAINVNLNANRFESPETQGEFLQGSVAAALTGSNTLIVVPDATANPPLINSPGWDRSNSSVRLSGSLGLFERLDVGVKAPWNGPVLFQAKYQFLGAPLARAQADNFAMAITLGAGTTQPGANATNTTNGISSHTSLSMTTYDAALIAGWRFGETWMVYGGPFLSSYNYSGSITQSGAASSLFPIQGSAIQGGANIGLQLDSVLGALRIEEAWAQASVSSIVQSGFYTGACLSYRF